MIVTIFHLHFNSLRYLILLHEPFNVECSCQCSPIADAGAVDTHCKSEVNYVSVV